MQEQGCLAFVAESEDELKEWVAVLKEGISYARTMFQFLELFKTLIYYVNDTQFKDGFTYNTALVPLLNYYTPYFLNIVNIINMLV